MDTLDAILMVLTSGKKTSSEIATELGLAPPQVTSRLAKLVSRQEVKKVGKIRSNGKDVTIYALAANNAHEPNPSEQIDSDFEIARRLHQSWGGYLPVVSRPSKKHLTLKHKME